MPNIRKILKILTRKPTIEGAGVHLNRVFGFYELPLLDPFLLLDDFRSDNPEDYIRGFPCHPHRGIETITYVIDGSVAHGDSLKNKGVIGSGDVQWMTAGSGIIHQEMPEGNKEGKMGGFQLWTNLPASHKMIDPMYRDVKNYQIPEISFDNGVKIKIICGQIGQTKGPVNDIVTDPEYLDITIPAGVEFIHHTKSEHTVFAYIIGGSGLFDGSIPISKNSSPLIINGNLVLFEKGEHLKVNTLDEYVRFLLISGKPIGEPIAWYGPIVMNSQEELQIAFEEYNNGAFIKYKI